MESLKSLALEPQMCEERDLDITLAPSTSTSPDTSALDDVEQLPEHGMQHDVWNGFGDGRRQRSRQPQLKLVKPPPQ